MNLKEIETLLDSTPAIKLSGLETPAEDNLLQFLIGFFSQYNNMLNTVLVSHPELIQTYTHRRRSLGDVYKICKYYFPNCTLSEVADCLYNKLFNEHPTFNSAICNDIKKRVFFLNHCSNIHYEEEAIDEYGNSCLYYKLAALDNSIEWWNLISSEKAGEFKIKYEKLYGKECDEDILQLYLAYYLNNSYDAFYDDDDDNYDDDY